IPNIEFDCTELGLPGYKFQKLSHDDAHILMLGYYTGCCEKIGDHFQETIEKSLSTRRHGYYVLMHDGAIKAHSWAWRGEGQQFVLDGWESTDKNIGSEFLRDIALKMADELSKPKYAPYRITDFIHGWSGKELCPENSFPQAIELAPRIACQWYFMDGINQWLIKRFDFPTKYEMDFSGTSEYAPSPDYPT
ncbi:MAG: hypothetical protein DI551_04530, partial [Micavibrio aeruginosavorus]